MKPVIASTGPSQTVATASAVIAAGGNAVDAAVGAVLAWPAALSAAGVMVAVGSGLGRGAVVFPARVPGFGLSRPRRFGLLNSRAAAAKVATPSAAHALVAALARWGTASIADVGRAAARAYGKGGAPHAAALELLGTEGVAAFSRGPYAAEAARALGPLEGGLLTRRDMIEARPELGEAHGPFKDLWAPLPIVEARRASAISASYRDEEARTLSVVVIDRRGVVVSAALEVGPRTDPSPPAVAGVTTNTLLSIQPAAKAKKVGQTLPLAVGALAGGEGEQLAIAGALVEIFEILDQEPLVKPRRVDSSSSARGLLWVRCARGGRPEIVGATAFESS